MSESSTIARIGSKPAENKDTMAIRILLLQARHSHDTARFDERESFARQAGLDKEQVVPFDLLLNAVELAHQLNIPSTFVETNCYWCLDDRSTREKLEALKKSGLEGILISVNPFYLECVPFERTERCTRIASKVFAQNTMVYQQEYYDRLMQVRMDGNFEAWVSSMLSGL